MKKIYLISTILLFVFITSASCSGIKNPDQVRDKNKRAVTINNKTGTPLSGYQLSTINGVIIDKGNTDLNSFSIKISDAWKNDTEIEILLIDRHNRYYAKTVNVPLKKNTDVTITTDDRKSENLLKDSWKDLEAWLNKNK